MDADVIVDALFGVGLNSPLREPGASAVKRINLSPAWTVSADIPSGVEADTGRVLGDAVQADVTVTFSLAKPGLYVGKGALKAGRVIVHDIGIPPDIFQNEEYMTHLIDGQLVKSWLPRRAADSHKGDFGRVLVVGGSTGYTGAPVLAARGALRAGAGLVTVAVPSSVYQIAAIKLDEAMVSPLPAGEDGKLGEEALMPLFGLLAGKDAALIGPGLGRSGSVDSLVCNVLTTVDFPLVVDADGINALAQHMNVLDGRRDCPTILTPHDGEFARLGGDLSQADRLGAARAFATEHGCLLVLKGHNTIVALPNGECFVNATGNAGMAKGGSGDVLGGMILALLGQVMNPVRAAVCAVYLHGYAGDLAAAELGEYGMLPSDLIERVPKAFKDCGTAR
jgi:NAD(P)H-hydrate epimerase